MSTQLARRSRSAIQGLTLAALALGVAPGLAAQPADPATASTYNCYYIRNHNWNYPGDGVGVVTGQIRWPSETCNSADGPPAGRPVLVFAHGNAMTHTDHEYLMAHLARNGFVTASISNAGDNETRARAMISYLNSLHTQWTWRHRLSLDVALGGHSRGGEAATTAARLLEEDGLGAHNYDVRAVVAIAPTDGGGLDGSDPRETLTGAMTRGFLAIYGSRDTDVYGSHATADNLEPQRTAFAHYDRAGSEASSEGLIVWGTHLDKAMVFLYGADHRHFLDTMNTGGGTTVGQNTARAYVNAFLRWKVLGDDDYRGFLDGTWRPDALADAELFQQFSAGTRRVLDNFEDGNLATNTLGGSVLDGGSAIITFLGGELHQMIDSSPHDTRGARITWAGGAGYTRWYIPNASPAFIGPLRDVSDYTHLSLRVGQIYLQAYNTPEADQDFHVRLYSSAGWSNKVPVSAYGRVPYPDEFVCNPLWLAPCGSLGGGGSDFTKSGMSTIRVPLSAFENVDLSDVRYVYLYFDVPGHDEGAVTIDSLEFVQ